jgi:hypothetical protein
MQDAVEEKLIADVRFDVESGAMMGVILEHVNI